MRPAEKDTRAGSGTPRAERGKSTWTSLSFESVDVDWGTSHAKDLESPLVRPTASTEKLNWTGMRHVDTSYEHRKLNICVRKNVAVCMCLGEPAVCRTREWCWVHKENHLGSCLPDPIKPGPQKAHQDHTGPAHPALPLENMTRDSVGGKLPPPSLSRVSVPRGQDLGAVGCGRARL